jgi:hypothetical protein
MNIDQVVKGTVLIPNSTGTPIHHLMGSAIQCLEAGEKGFKFRRMNITHDLEEFFLNRHGLETSNWTLAPDNSQLRFF